MLIGQAFLLDLPARTYDEMFLEVTARYKESPTSGFQSLLFLNYSLSKDKQWLLQSLVLWVKPIITAASLS
jgi:hypothetical protein